MHTIKSMYLIILAVLVIMLPACGDNDTSSTDTDSDIDTDIDTDSDTDTDIDTGTDTDTDSSLTWPSYTIDNTFGFASGIHACDMDGDGDRDIVGSAGGNISDMAWWRNDGGKPIVWTKQIIDGFFEAAMHAFAADVDGDSHMDVLGAAWAGHEIAWWRNDGNDPIAWTKQTIRSKYMNAHEVYACDLDNDGDTDVLGASAADHLISWWRNDGGNPIVWTEFTVGSDFGGARSVFAADIDDDKDMDVVGAATDDNEVAWFRNDGGDPIEWTKIVVDNEFTGSHAVSAPDINGDDRADILAVAFHANEISWWRNNGGDPVVWTKQLIDNTIPSPMMAHAQDLDNDGDLDVIGSSRDASRIFWWENHGEDPIEWTRYTVAENFTGAWPVYAADFDGDGDNDIAGATEGGSLVAWFENVLNE